MSKLEVFLWRFANEDLTYGELTAVLNVSVSGGKYCRRIESRLITMKFTKYIYL